MQIVSSGRFVYYAQWIAAVALPVFIVVGRLLVGSYGGWLTVIGWIFAIPLIVLMLVPPILARWDTAARQAKSARAAYVVASWVLWIGLLIVGVTVTDQADSSESGSALTAWTGGDVSPEVSMGIAGVVLVVAMIALIAQFIVAIAGIRHSRQNATASVTAPPAA